MKTYAIIVAGGTGKRMGAGKPKQLLEIGGKSILELTLNPFLECDEINGIIISSSSLIIEEIKSITEKTAPVKSILIVEGGKERQDSVRNALNTIPEDTEVVLIHDAVRPFIDKETLSLCADEAFKKNAVIVMRPIKETVKTVLNGIITGTIERSTVWAAQTPQAFRYKTIMEAHRRAFEDGFLGTDDSMLVERLGVSVHVIEGTERNIKITTPFDLIIAKEFLKN